MIHYDSCPLCGAGKTAQAISVKDYTVSGEVFFICRCEACSGMYTQDVPSEDAIGPYYASANYISHSNTQKGLINNLYHRVRAITLKAKRRLVEQHTGRQSGKLLDVGCGTGAFLNEMTTAGWQVTGLEPDPFARKNAAELFNIDALPSHELFTLPPNSFHAITMWHVLEHVHQLHEYLTQLKTLLSASGRLIIAVPNYTSYDAQHYAEHWAAYDAPRHLYHFSPASMQALVERHGMQVSLMQPMWFDSFYVSMLSEQYKNGKGNVIKAFVTGAMSNIKALFDKERCSSVIYIIQKRS